MNFEFLASVAFIGWVCTLAGWGLTLSRFRRLVGILRSTHKPEPDEVWAPPRIILEVDLKGKEHTARNLRRALQYADEDMGKLTFYPTRQTLMVVNFLGSCFATIFVRTENDG